MLLNLGAALYKAAIYIASPFNSKANKIVAAQKDYFPRLEDALAPYKDKAKIWIHCASLGEFEQGRPLIEYIKENHQRYAVLLTFFSPSGYEVRKDYALADVVAYFPLDGSQNARKFLAAVRPKLAIFVKYELWPATVHELDRHKTPLVVVSAIFRSSQVFFGPSKTIFLPLLKKVNHFFVQDQQSFELLGAHGIKHVTISGDTRFDRVSAVAEQPKAIPLVEQFLDGGRFCIVAGSTWAEDTNMLAQIMPSLPKNIKIIIAPHEVHPQSVNQVADGLGAWGISLFSAGKPKPTDRILLIDNIGMLSSLYRYADIAYVGGGFRTGLHNTLEAAVYGIPVLIGPLYQKFKEAVDLTDLGGIFVVENSDECAQILAQLFQSTEKRALAGSACLRYVEENRGATLTIMTALAQDLQI